MPTTTSPLSRYFVQNSFRAGALASQYGQPGAVHQRTRTTLPRSDASVSGLELIQSVTIHSLGLVPTSSRPSPAGAAYSFGSGSGDVDGALAVTFNRGITTAKVIATTLIRIIVCMSACQRTHRIPRRQDNGWQFERL